MDRDKAHYNVRCQVARRCILNFGLVWTGLLEEINAQERSKVNIIHRHFFFPIEVGTLLLYQIHKGEGNKITLKLYNFGKLYSDNFKA